MPKHHPLASYLARRRWRTADARSALSALKASGLSPHAFAAREGLDVDRLYRWRRRLATQDPAPEATPKFVEVRPCGMEPETIEVVLRSGRVLRASEAIAPSALVRLVAAIEGLESC